MKIFRLAALAAACFWSLTPGMAAAQEEGQKKETNIISENITGYYSIVYRDFNNSGNKGEFYSRNSLLFFNQNLEHNASLHFSQKLENEMNISADYTQLQGQDNTISGQIQSRRGISNFGDFTSDFPSGELAKFSKTIRGMDFSYNFDSWGFTMMGSKEKSKKVTESFKGQNHRGPYRLQNGSIMRGTVTLKIDGNELSPSLYDVDYFQGELYNFAEAVSSASVIEVTYETELLIALKTGSLRGFSAYYNKPNTRWQGMVSVMSEGSNRDPDEITYSRTANFSAADIVADAELDLGVTRVNWSQALTAVYDPGGAGEVELKENADFQVDRANGRIAFLSACTVCFGGANISVEFFYFNSNLVRKKYEEILTGDGRVDFPLSKETIYPGTEKVYLYNTDTGLRDGSPLVSDIEAARDPNLEADYSVYEDRNSIILLDGENSPNSLLNRALAVDYEYIQREGSNVTETTRNVYDVVVKGKLAKTWNMEFEAAQSDSDTSKKPITVVEEFIETTTAAKTEFLLKHVAIGGTVEIFFDDTVRNEARKREGTDFRIELDDTKTMTKITFKQAVPAGTTLIANYQFLPTATPGKSESGTALRLASGYTGKKFTLNGEWIQKDQQYSPLNDYDNFDTNNLKADLSVQASKNLRIFSNLNKYDRAHDLAGAGEDQFLELKTGAEYSNATFPKIAYTREAYRADDNLATAAKDNQRDIDRFELSWNPTRGKRDLALTAYVENNDFTDNLGGLSDQIQDKNRFEVNAGYRRLKLKMYTEGANLGTKAPTGFSANSSFDSTTRANMMHVDYSLGSIWNLAGEMLLQDRRDSRPNVQQESLDTADIKLTAEPFGRVKNARMGFTRQDRPNVFQSGGSRSDQFTAGFYYSLTRWFSVSPGYSINQSSQIGQSESDQRNATLDLYYNDGRDDAFAATVSYKDGRRESRNATATTNEGNDQWNLSMFYYPTRKWNMTGRYTADRNSSSSAADMDKYSLETNYKIGDKLTAKLNATTENRNLTAGDEKTTNYIFEVQSVVGANLDLSLNYDLEKFQAQADPTRDYHGTTLTAELRLNL